MAFPMLLVLVVLAATDAVATITITRRASAEGGGEHQIAIARDGCKDKCGDLRVPYPFGIGNGCYFRPEFNITCSESKDEPTVPRLMKTRMVVTNISLEDGELGIMQLVNRDCYDKQGKPTDKEDQTVGGLWVYPPYTISGDKNRFFSVGCDTYAHFFGRRGEQRYTTGCISVCPNGVRDLDEKNMSCSGMGCCETKIPPLLNNMSLTVGSYNNHIYVNEFNPCGFAFVAQKDNFTFSSTSFQQLRKTPRLPLVLDWQISDESCKFARQNMRTFACKGNTTCHDRDTGYICLCNPGFQGNPYLDGCKDIDECASPQKRCQNGKCLNIPGNYTCSCDSGYENQDKIKCIKASSGKPLKISLGTSLSFSVLVVGIFWTYRGMKKRKIQKLKATYFEANGGPLLREKLASIPESDGKSATVFTEEQVRKATKNYCASEIIGDAGNGTVYKGIINRKIVAIKKPKVSAPVTAKKQLEAEMLVLSKINHKSIVRFLGGCFETETPILVYEFTKHGTLYDHIHRKNEKGSSQLPLELRLKIAAETADAVAYLHNSISPPIIHRDVTTKNILIMDPNFTPKVSNFGDARLGPEDGNQISTLVQGRGYLDPEYLQSNTLTEKSDVYSFGVVLVELLTSRSAFSPEKPEAERSLANVFVSKEKEGLLDDILDKEIVSGHNDSVAKVTDLAKRCLRLRREERPSMREVAAELEELVRAIAKHSSAADDGGSSSGIINNAE